MFVCRVLKKYVARDIFRMLSKSSSLSLLNNGSVWARNSVLATFLMILFKISFNGERFVW